MSTSPSSRLDILLWAVAWLLTATALFFSLGPAPPFGRGFDNADKVWHGGLYLVTVLVFLFAAVWRPGRGSGRYPRRAPLIVITTIATGIGVEILQGTFFHRDMEFLDAAADVVGVTAALGVWSVVSLLARPRRLSAADPDPGSTRSRAGS